MLYNKQAEQLSKSTTNRKSTTNARHLYVYLLYALLFSKFTTNCIMWKFANSKFICCLLFIAIHRTRQLQTLKFACNQRRNSRENARKSKGMHSSL